MTDHDPQLDELVSAHLDGEASPADAARVESETGLRHRLEELAAARDAVRRDVPVPDDAAREAVLARVLEQLDRPASATARVTPLARRRFDPSRVLAIAAAVVAIAFLGGALALLGGGDSDDQDTAAEAPAGDSAAGADAAGTYATTDGALEDSAERVVDLGAVADEDELRAALDRALPNASTRVTDAAPETDREGVGEGEDGPGASATPAPQTFAAGCEHPADAATFRAALGGRPVVVLVQDTEVRVLDAQSCDLVSTFTR